LAVFVAALWGGNFLAVHYGLAHFPPFLLASLRMAVIAVPTVLFVRPPSVRWRWVIGYGLGFGTVQFGFLFLSMSAGLPTGLASLVLQASAPFTVLLAGLLLRERLRVRQRVGIGIAVAGLAAIAVARSAVAPLGPLLLCLAGALGWAVGNLCARQARSDSPVRLMLWMSVIPPVPLFALSWWMEGPSEIRAAVSAVFTPAGLPGVAALAYLVVCASLLGQGTWTFLMNRYPAGTVAPYSLLVPVVGLALAVLVLGERPGPVELIAGVFIVGGVLLGTPPSARGSSELVQPGASDAGRFVARTTSGT
jgi:drug/metabolite transporter (DMT)-like permease